jgi:hypothetical protein
MSLLDALRTPIGKAARGRVDPTSRPPFWRSIPARFSEACRGLTWRRWRNTPWRDLLRGRLIASLDWQRLIASADLPQAQRELIHEVVRRTRLWRRERVVVADELIDHFTQANEATDGYGPSRSHDPVAAFGDPAVAAKLIRRAKRRCRPLGWQIRHRLRQGVVVLAIVYALAALYLATGKPEPSVDYLAILNAPLAEIAEEDKAWPILREAMIEHRTWDDEAFLAPMDRGVLPKAWTRIQYDDPEVEALAANLSGYQSYLADLRRAAERPMMGESLAFNRTRNERDMLAFYGPDWADEVDDGWHQQIDNPSLAALLQESLVGIMLPTLGHHRRNARLLSADTQVAIHLDDGGRTVRNIETQIRLAALITQGATLIEDLVGVSIAGFATRDTALVIEHRPELFDRDQLERLQVAFAYAIGRVTVDFDGERLMGLDTFQRMYDPDTGLMTRDGLQLLTLMGVTSQQESSAAANVRGFVAGVALPATLLATADYDAMVEEYERLMAMNDAARGRLYPRGESSPLEAEMEARLHDRTWRVRYFPLAVLTPALGAAGRTEVFSHAAMEAVGVAVALERFYLDHDRYPDDAADLVPTYLTALPMDLTDVDADGHPRSTLKVAYRDDGVPIVYGLGWDGDDDGGVRPEGQIWPTPNGTEHGGDWVLFPMPADDAN